MIIRLKAKYRRPDRVDGYPAKARTGNSHGPAKGRKKTGKWNQGQQRVMRVDGATGKRRMEDA